ncbi:MAG TPA: VWA domain-containing protein [Candidatus Sulfotelmatobacter sp.]|nr:VWA domain-containing protein [Candidatus Sulfotelmatobacter sp.]
MLRSAEHRLDLRWAGLILGVGAALLAAGASPAQNPAPPPPAPSAGTPASSAPSQAPAPPSEPNIPNDANAAEVTTHDTAPTFKVRVNEVLVRVVVRDASGKVIPNLRKEDFQLLDNRKPQTITSFRIETPETNAVRSQAVTTESPDGGPPTVTPVPVLPQRFVAVIFDDIDLAMQDAASVRYAAQRLFDSLAPSDRVGVFSTSGQVIVDFTSDRTRLKDSLSRIVPRPLTGAGIQSCPNITAYQAKQIVEMHDSVAFQIAGDEFVACTSVTKAPPLSEIQTIVSSQAQAVLTAVEGQIDYTFRHLEDVVRRLAVMPGQRVAVFISPGFFLTTQTLEQGELIDRANKANIVINTIDARGLYTPNLLGDISEPNIDLPQTQGAKDSFRMAEQFENGLILGELADGTGGTYFHNRNDLDAGMMRAVVAPEVSYLLGFSPQNLKYDGKMHLLKVSLASKSKFVIQARHGYYAPRTVKDPAQEAKEDIQEAIFSQEEIRDVPIELQTQFFKSSDTQAKLAVLTRVDMNAIRFRKDAGRSRDNLTFAAAIFDENGNFITGGEKIIEMRLLDATLTRLNRTGLTVKSSFDIKPGTYLVRMVVRDGEGTQMAAKNGAVTIPY